MEPYDLIVIGAGPAGLMAACRAASSGLRVCLLEKNSRPGRKLLLAGSGRCNLTHAGEITDFFSKYGKNGRFVKSLLYAFSPEDLEAFFKIRGLSLKELNEGKVFPETEKSSHVLSILVSECESCGVRMLGKSRVKSVENSDRMFRVETQAGIYYTGLRLLVAAGGCSFPDTGSNGDGFRIAGQLGHTVTELRPGLAPCETGDSPFLNVPGISINTIVRVFRGGRKQYEWSGSLLFTHRGISGPVVLNNSRYLLPGDRIELNLSGKDADEISRELTSPLVLSGGRRIKTLLTGWQIPGRLVELILKASGIPDDQRVSELKKKARQRLIGNLTSFPLELTRPGGWKQAMVTSGGVDLKDVNPRTLESKIVPGLFFAGEVLDVDGDEGGYNLQFAFSSGWVAGNSIAAGRDKKIP